MFKNYSIVDMINSGIVPQIAKKSILEEPHLLKKEKPNKVKIKSRKSRPYYKKVWIQTELSAPFIEGIELRGWRGKHIEHIVPISYGEKHNIPPCLIGSIENLIMLSHEDNMKKGRKLTKDSIRLLKKWGYEIPKH